MAKTKKTRAGEHKFQPTNFDRRGAVAPVQKHWTDRMAEFVAAIDVRPEWMPKWIHEKHVDALNEERDHHEEVFRKLEDNGTFQKIEAARGLPLCPDAHGQLAAALAFARCYPLGVGARQRQPKREKLAD